MESSPVTKLQEKIAKVALQYSVPIPTLIAVSKFHPIEAIVELYYQRNISNFGENFVDELLQKATQFDSKLREADKKGALQEAEPRILKWHYIGLLQSSKITKLCRQFPLESHLSRLEALHSLFSLNHARLLHKEWQKRQHRLQSLVATDPLKYSSYRLKVFIQVNTSGRVDRVGLLTLTEIEGLVKILLEECNDSLELVGLFCIADNSSQTVSQLHESNIESSIKSNIPVLETDSHISNLEHSCSKEFLKLSSFKAQVEDKFKGLSLSLSMGMSNDYEEAIRFGSHFVRIGTAVFGERSKNK